MTITDPAHRDMDALAVALTGHNDPVGMFRDALGRISAILDREFDAGVAAAELVQRRATLMDQLLRKAWARHGIAGCDDIGIVAVGGYGRGELHPHSDIDLMILTPPALEDPQRRCIEEFLTFTWDIGLNVGHSVRSVAHCAEVAATDITIATNLMESRLLVGPRALYDEMVAATSPAAIWPSREFFAAKWREQKARHHKFDDTTYNLEPNIKEGPGGLRDIQMIGWVLKRHSGAATLHELVVQGFLTENEYQALISGQNFLWQIRYGLHLLSGRREERLLFDYQRALAARFGYSDKDHRLAVEHFMKDFFRTALELSRLNEILLQHFQEAILHSDAPVDVRPINKRFQSRNGFVEVTAENVFRRYPFALLEIFLLLEQNQDLQGVRASTIRLIREHHHLIDDAFRNNLSNRSLFMEILRQPRGVTHELRRMNRYGVLAAYWPAFGRIVGQMQYDLFHVYTVDEHTLRVLRNIRRYFVAEFADELPLCTEIAKRLPKPDVLYLGGLFHDIAKGRGGDHSDLGAQEAIDFCLHHGLSQYDARFVAWLVRNHLKMSLTAQRKDISDPDVINEFARLVGDETHLDYLYVMTVADIRATNPSLWNGWKDSLLAELYGATRRALRRGLEQPVDKTELIIETQAAARALLRNQNVKKAEFETFWSNAGEDYFLRYSAEEIAWHTGEILKHPARGIPLILVREHPERGGTEVFIYAPDQDYLFAKTTGILARYGLNILEARILTTQDRYALDSFIVVNSDGLPIASRFQAQELVEAIGKGLQMPIADFPTLTIRMSRQMKHFHVPTEISFGRDERNQRTIMDLVASDRPGLLSLIGEAMVKCDVILQNAKVATIGAHVEDVFYITDRAGKPLEHDTQFHCLTETITALLDKSRPSP